MRHHPTIVVSLIAVAALAALHASATPASEITVTTRNISAQTVVGGQPDVLALDVTIAAPRGLAPRSFSEGGDVLDSLTVEQAGTAGWQNDIVEAELWRDAGPPGFQGIGVDTSLKIGGWVATERGWVFDRVFEPVAESGTRFFVTVSSANQPTSGATVQLRIPTHRDSFQSMSYDTGDRGIFLRTARPAPLQAVGNPAVFTFDRRTTDELPPIVRITEPADGASFSRDWLLVRGVAQDVGGSSVAKVLVGVNRVGRAITWVEAVPEAAGFATWEARLFGLPAPTTLELRVRGEDWIGNRSVETVPMMVTLTAISN
jgi:hypothetical protein